MGGSKEEEEEEESISSCKGVHLIWVSESTVHCTIQSQYGEVEDGIEDEEEEERGVALRSSTKIPPGFPLRDNSFMQIEVG